MPEIPRNRELVLLFKGDAQPVAISEEMALQGWTGGQGVQWCDVSEDVRTVTFSTGLYGGVMMYGSSEPSDQFTSMTPAATEWRLETMLSGGNLLMTSTYERYTWASRQGPGPLVPIVYGINDVLHFSLRGWFTNEDEATITHQPFAPGFFVGFVAMVPKASNNYYIGVQTSM